MMGTTSYQKQSILPCDTGPRHGAQKKKRRGPVKAAPPEAGSPFPIKGDGESARDQTTFSVTSMLPRVALE